MLHQLWVARAFFHFVFVNKSLYLAREFAHYMFLKPHSALSENCSLLGTDISAYKSRSMFSRQMKATVFLIISLSTRAVIGQFSGPYSPVRPAKF